LVAKVGAAAHVGGRVGGDAGGSADVEVTGLLIAGIMVAAACVIAWTAASYARPRFSYAQFTEDMAPAQNFESHLAHPAELLHGSVYLPVRYPDRTAPGITSTMHEGFAQQWRANNPADAAMPSEAAW
jgi:hypothetical protein